MSQNGSIYERNKTWFLKYRTTALVGGKRKLAHKTERPCLDNPEYGNAW